MLELEPDGDGRSDASETTRPRPLFGAFSPHGSRLYIAHDDVAFHLVALISPLNLVEVEQLHIARIDVRTAREPSERLEMKLAAV